MLLLVAVAIAALLGLSLVMVGYSLVGVVLLAIVDIAIRMRRVAGYLMGMRLGQWQQLQQENAQLRQSVQEALQRNERLVPMLQTQATQKAPQQPAVSPKNHVAYNPSADEALIIDNALLIHQQYITGSSSKYPTKLWTRERMESDGHLSQQQWNVAMHWLRGAGVVEYKNRSVAIWIEADATVVKAMLMRHGQRNRVSV
jgi:hypothetical protein